MVDLLQVQMGSPDYNPPQSRNQPAPASIWPRLVAPMAVSFCLFFVLLAGVFMSGVAFRDPDTCWLLAMGRWIVEHHSLPYRDPYSSNIYTYMLAGTGLPLIQYQWIPETLFYLAWKAGNYSGLIYMLSAVAAAAFVAIPLWTMRRLKSLTLPAIIVLIGTGAASLRFLARPELFSNMFLALLVATNIDCAKPGSGEERQTERFALPAKTLVRSAATLVVMCLWANSHMLFPLGIIFLAANFVGQWIDARLTKRQVPLFQLLAPLVAGVAGTFISPWGWALWEYDIRLLGSWVSHENVDHQSANLSFWDFKLFLVLLAIYICNFVVVVRKYRLRAAGAASVLLAALATAVAFKYAKLVPPGVVLLTGALAQLLYQNEVQARPDAAASGSNSGFFSALDQSFSTLLRPLAGKASALWCVVAVLGSATWIQQAGIPSCPGTTVNFKPPFAALEFIETHGIKGKLLNEGLYGSVMTWHLTKPPDIFMDSRFSQFEPDLVKEYENMMVCSGDWQSLLSKHKIETVFVPASVPLAKTLSQDSSWREAYRDADAVIFERKERL